MKLAKRLKKEKVNVDIINFGEEVSKDRSGGTDCCGCKQRTVLTQRSVCMWESSYRQELTWQRMGSRARRSASYILPSPGGEHRKADRLCKHIEWQRRNRFSSGDSASWAQLG